MRLRQILWHPSTIIQECNVLDPGRFQIPHYQEEIQFCHF